MMLPPVGVKSCKNTVPFFGGKDAESDEELRKRVLMSYKTVINGGNKEYYRQNGQVLVIEEQELHGVVGHRSRKL